MIYKFKAAYTKLGVGTAPSVAPTCTVVDSDDNMLANAQPTTALTNMTGVYLYSYNGAVGLDLVGRFRTTDATVDQQDLYSYTSDLITTNLDAKVSTRTMLGAGAITWTYNLVDALGAAIGNAQIWVTTDAAGTIVIASDITDAFGNATFYLDPGTYYIWGEKPGYNFTNPDLEIV